VFWFFYALVELANSLEMKTVQDSPLNATDNELISKLKTENEQLKV